MRTAAYCLVLTISLLLSGCWSVASTVGDVVDGEVPRVYSGTRNWYTCWTHHDTSVLLALFTIPDLPLTFILDTGLLPLTAPLNIIEEIINAYH